MNLFPQPDSYPFPDQRFRFEWDLFQLGKKNIAGVDEAGRGPLAGCVVASSVILNPENLIWKIDDSKKLSESEREELFDEIIEKAISFGIGISETEEIDQLNILQATVLAMKRSLENLTLSPDFILVDGNYGILGMERIKPIVKGDALSISIGAASIIAKVTRDRMMKDLHQKFPEYGFDQHKGYGTKHHVEMIRKFGYSPVHRKSFKVKELQGFSR